MINYLTYGGTNLRVGSGETININVYGAQGQDVTALAHEVERVLVRAQRSRSAVFA